jgi:iron-sulfur cluster assembly protein
MAKALLSVTDNAVERIKALMALAPEATQGLRLSTPQRGCSGLMYKVDYVAEANPMDERVDTTAGTLFVDSASLLYLIGSEMDWQEDDFTAGFTFRNPNEKGRCGCGESFTV